MAKTVSRDAQLGLYGVLVGVALSLLPTWLVGARDVHDHLANQYGALLQEANRIETSASLNAARFTWASRKKADPITGLEPLNSNLWNASASQSDIIADIRSDGAYQAVLDQYQKVYNRRPSFNNEFVFDEPWVVYEKVDELNDKLNHYVIFSEMDRREPQYQPIMRGFNTELENDYKLLTHKARFLELDFTALTQRQAAIAADYDRAIIAIWVLALVGLLWLILWPSISTMLQARKTR